jgi:hypothetical protein
VAPLPGPEIAPAVVPPPPPGPPPIGGIYDDCEEDIVAPVTGPAVGPPPPGLAVGFDTYEAEMNTNPTPAVPNYSAELDTNTTETPTFSAELDTHATDLPNAESDTVPLDHESKVESNAVFSSSSTINVSQTMIILFAISLIFS